jgi:hypothetical protein
LFEKKLKLKNKEEVSHIWQKEKERRKWRGINEMKWERELLKMRKIWEKDKIKNNKRTNDNPITTRKKT